MKEKNLVKNILQNIPECLFWKNKSGSYLGANQSFLKLCGLSEANLIGKTDNDLCWCQQANVLIKLDDQVLATGKSKEIELKIQVATGEKVASLVKKSRLINDNNETIGIVGTISKLSSQSANETNLKNNTDSAKHIAHITNVFLQNITRSLPQYVFWKDKSSVYLGCNQNYARLVGLSSTEDIIGKTDFDLNWQSVGDTSETFRQGDQDTVEGKYITNQEEVLALPGGKKIITLVSKLPIIDDEKVIGIVGYFTDITELKSKEAELVRAKKAADLASTAKTAFIRNISHDIRTPLAGMIGMAEVLSREMKTSTQKEAISGLLESSHLLLDLLNEVIELVRLDSGEVPVTETQFSLKELINSLSRVISPSIQQKKLVLNIDFDAKIPSLLIGDKVRVHRILLNLLSNAIKFTDAGYINVFIKLVQESDTSCSIKFIVEDSGIGISVEDQKKIFSRFSRVDPSYKGIYKGRGLGLSIVKQFVTELEGEVSVSSELNQGSTFACVLHFKFVADKYEVTIPLELKDSAIAASVNGEEGGVLPYRVLVVEDNHIALSIAVSQLTQVGFVVDKAASGQQAIALAQVNMYDLVLVDIGLPDISGYEVSARIRAIKPNRSAMIVALTAHNADLQTKDECKIAGIDEAISKPLTGEIANELLVKLASVVNTNLIKITESKTVDIDLGIKVAGGNRTVAKEIFNMFLQELPSQVDTIKQYYLKGDMNLFKFEVHKLHGAICYCGVPRLKEIAAKLERELSNSEMTPKLSVLYELFINECTKLLESKHTF